MKKVILSDRAYGVANKRYFVNGEDWEACSKRVATTISGIEKYDVKERVKNDFFEMINDMNFIPGGRVLRNSGMRSGSLFNCYHLPIDDSIEEIGKCMKDSLTLWSEGGGVGINFTSLRPKGDQILGKGGYSSGLVSFIEAHDAVAKVVEGGGGRRAAGIAHVHVDHPEVLDFIDAKLVHGKLQHFNISVAINGAFIDAVEADRNWEFRFQQRSYGKMSARKIWNKIIENMVTSAEPGLINWDKFTKNNSYYFSPVVGTNPCGETTLEGYGVCVLGSLVLPNFIATENTNWKKLETTIKTAVRFLDNVIDANKYILKENDQVAHNTRRIGLGIMGLADYLFAKKLRYGSEKAISETERLMKFIRDATYQSSIELAVEKGSFPKFEPLAFCKASFIRKLPVAMKLDIKKYGIRNCTTMAIAPTGTISLVPEVTASGEPLFFKAYKTNDRLDERIYIHPFYAKILESGEDTPEWFVDSKDLNPSDHFEMQVALQKYVDGSVSKTINLPKESTSEELSKLLIEYIYDLKGVTVYKDGSREGQPIVGLTEKEAKSILKNEIVDFKMDLSDVECASGKCEL
jgi:ribonucleoside-diphosphate reductase alpha chain